MPEEVRWIELRSLPGPIFAEMAKEILQDAGIPCVLKKDFMASAYGVQGAELNPGEMPQLLVPENRAEEASRILEDMIGDI